jgi:hypothetical protein
MDEGKVGYVREADHVSGIQWCINLQIRYKY